MSMSMSTYHHPPAPADGQGRGGLDLSLPAPTCKNADQRAEQAAAAAKGLIESAVGAFFEQDLLAAGQQLLAKSEKIQQWARTVETQNKLTATCKAFLAVRRFRKVRQAALCHETPALLS